MSVEPAIEPRWELFHPTQLRQAIASCDLPTGTNHVIFRFIPKAKMNTIIIQFTHLLQSIIIVVKGLLKNFIVSFSRGVTFSFSLLKKNDGHFW